MYNHRNGLTNHATPFGRAKLRFEHNVAAAPNVDVYANGQKIISNLGYTKYHGYLDVAAGRYNISVHAANSPNAFLNAAVDISAGDSYTVVVHGDIRDRASIGALVLEDNNMCPHNGSAHVRFIHATPSAPMVDVLADGSVIFQDVAYGQAGNPVYLPVPAGRHSLAVNLANTTTTALGPIDVDLADRGIYTIIAAGIPGNQQTPLTAVIINEPECM